MDPDVNVYNWRDALGELRLVEPCAHDAIASSASAAIEVGCSVADGAVFTSVDGGRKHVVVRVVPVERSAVSVMGSTAAASTSDTASTSAPSQSAGSDSVVSVGAGPKFVIYCAPAPRFAELLKGTFAIRLASSLRRCNNCVLHVHCEQQGCIGRRTTRSILVRLGWSSPPKLQPGKTARFSSDKALVSRTHARWRSSRDLPSWRLWSGS